MERTTLLLVCAGLLAGCVTGTAALPAPGPIETVAVGPERGFRVNGQPFFPIMIWLQAPNQFDNARAAGINTIAGYWPGSGGTADVVDYLDLVEQAGFYGVMPYHAGLRGDAALLGYIHDDEPDLTRTVSDAVVEPAVELRLNRDTPLWKILDGAPHSWSVLDPLEGAAVAIRRQEPVTVEKLGVWLTVSPGLAVAREVELLADGQPLATATLENRKGRQEIALPQPATFRELTFRVVSTYPGDNVWGSLGEIEGFDAAGENVLASPPRQVPKAMPEESAEVYRAIRSGDPSRPVFMTLTARYMQHFEAPWTPDEKATLYPAWIAAADVVGYDLYPLYGWGRPDWLHLGYDGTVELAELAGGKPVYAWIETSKGGQFVSAEQQPEVEPRHIRAEVWMAIIGGATGIGYFTHVWQPAYSQFGVPPENVAAMREINEQITRLTPAIYGTPTEREVAIALPDDQRAAIVGREHDGHLYLFAVNHDSADQAADATVTVPGLKAGATVDVIDEGRSLTAEAGGFRDRFEGLAVHLYRVPREALE